METNGPVALRDSFLRPSAYKYSSHNRLDASLVDLPGALTSQVPRALAVSLPSSLPFTKIGFLSGATALAGGVHQFAVITDAARKLVAVSADRTNTAWAAWTMKDFTFAATSLIDAALQYYAWLVVDAATPPSLAGTLDANAALAALAPIIAGNSSTTGVTALPAVGTTWGAIAASPQKQYLAIG